MSKGQEKDFLKKYNLEDFRHLTKDFVMQLSSSFDKLNSEVQLKVLEQIPDFSAKALDAVKACRDMFSKNIDSDDVALKECSKLKEKHMDILAEQLRRDDIDSKERLYILNELKGAFRDFSEIEAAHHRDHEQDGRVLVALSALLIAVVGAAIGVRFNQK